MLRIGRRLFLTTSAPWALAAFLGLHGRGARAAQEGAALGPARPFDFSILRQRAKALAAKQYAAPKPAVPDLLKTIDFDTMQKIRFQPEYGLWTEGNGPFAVRFFHLNQYADLPVKAHVLMKETAREVLYAPRYFDYSGTDLEGKLPPDLGFAGFRVMDNRTSDTDWLAFLGACYFRSAGALGQYGASARGIAVNTALSTREEFPRFTEFWLAEPVLGSNTITIYALLDGPSLTGAYRFDAVKDDGVVIDVHAELFTRRDIPRLGIAPLTSMYWYGENDRRRATDWRPEIHDSDGLALWTGKSERIWRPLVNPPSVQTNAFLDIDPKGFGLLQRDRSFDHYQDDGAFYDKRPSIWVEPRDRWGEGAVKLVEIPTDDEIHDNIVAFWEPKDPVTGGGTHSLDYRLHWLSDEPHPPATVARVVATRLGRGGVPGVPRPANKRKFVIDFSGGPLDSLERRFDLKPTVSVSRGKVDNDYVIKVVGTDRWRAFFDLSADGKDPVDIRCYVRLEDRTLTETWLYQYHPYN